MSTIAMVNTRIDDESSREKIAPEHQKFFYILFWGVAFYDVRAIIWEEGGSKLEKRSTAYAHYLSFSLEQSCFFFMLCIS